MPGSRCTQKGVAGLLLPSDEVPGGALLYIDKVPGHLPPYLQLPHYAFLSGLMLL